MIHPTCWKLLALFMTQSTRRQHVDVTAPFSAAYKVLLKKVMAMRVHKHEAKASALDVVHIALASPVPLDVASGSAAHRPAPNGERRSIKSNCFLRVCGAHARACGPSNQYRPREVHASFWHPEPECEGCWRMEALSLVAYHNCGRSSHALSVSLTGTIA